WYTAVPCCASSRTRRLHDAHPILAPDARVRGEVALEVAPAVRVIPEKERHGRHGPCEDQFAHLVNDGPAMLVVRLHLGSQRPALDLPGPHGQERYAADKSGAYVRAAADAG